MILYFKKKAMVWV